MVTTYQTWLLYDHYFIHMSCSVQSMWYTVHFSVHPSSPIRKITNVSGITFLSIPHSLKFSRGKHFTDLPNSTTISWIKFSWSNFWPCLASVMNLKFHGRKLSQACSDHWNLWKIFNLKNFRLCGICFSLPATNLTQLASQLPKLTPEVILASMKQLQQQQQAVVNAAQQQSLMQVNILCTVSSVHVVYVNFDGEKVNWMYIQYSLIPKPNPPSPIPRLLLAL